MLIWRLFKYIIANKSTPITTEKLIDILWPDGNCDNPLKALYSLMFRLRAILKSEFSDDTQFFIFRHNSYVWNDSAPYWLDTEEFEQLLTKAKDKSAPDKLRLDYYRKAFELYKGDYLKESSYDSWALPYTNFYKRLYSDTLSEYATLGEIKKKKKSIIDYCEKAIAMDVYEESNHITLIKALINIGQFSQATAHYNYIVALLQKDLGVQPSEQLQALNSQIKGKLGDTLYNLEDIQKNYRKLMRKTKLLFIAV